MQAFPQDSYNTSVTAAAASNSLPCILDVDGSERAELGVGRVSRPAWTAWTNRLSKFLPTTVGSYNGKNYSVGYFDVALAMYARKSALEKNGIRIPTMDQPWTKDEFDAALKAIKASGDYQYPLDMQTGDTGEWWPYAFSPLLQSFGGDLINRSDFKSAPTGCSTGRGRGLGDVVPVTGRPTGTCR